MGIQHGPQRARNRSHDARKAWRVPGELRHGAADDLYDGDPFDALVLGPSIPGGRLVRGIIVGLMLMENETGWDPKVVLSRTGPDGKPLHQLTTSDQDRMADYFNRYKAHEPGKFSKVPGWGSPDAGLAYVTITHTFFQECRTKTAAPCRVRHAPQFLP